ncbi:hypothetical protein Val02_70870 [Virgisporangium aliadipatigenens]|uniref:Uncharacterized protein n=1 Tax=Virgisporangium aliadipatigenens TaxID=741659 RepID=A0A8J4DUC7_9ACTN|nr:DUF6232 family protein [Virgisporangium aliadipatigenens]GIJ50201.1 hypothetical protein Val02_70870 [Virgisporangium aliadipatigenens]
MEATRRLPRRTFYRDGDIIITDRWLTISGRRFQVAELVNLRAVRRPAHPMTVASTAMACVLVAAMATFVALSGEPALLFGGPLLVGLPAGVAVMSWRLRRNDLTLFAEYGDATVQLVDDLEERRFNQVCRALIRAREYDEQANR